VKAIKTKFVGPTSTKPSRIRASAEGVKSKFYWVHSLQDETRTDRAEDWHGLAARFFQEENGWTYHGGNPANGVQRLASGQVGPDEHVHCFIERDVSPQGFLQGRDLVVAQARTFIQNSCPARSGTPNGNKICSAYHFELLRNALEQLDALG
jgi:hypothetical protein